MQTMNCWEFKKCGREPGGQKALELGVCPAANAGEYNNLNGGTNGGRICWAVAGTLCGGIVQGVFAEKRLSCMSCEFLLKVQLEQGTENFILLMTDKK